jgi:hypothetical protein
MSYRIVKAEDSGFKKLASKVFNFLNTDDDNVEIPVENPPITEQAPSSIWDQIKSRRNDKDIITTPKQTNIDIKNDDSASSGKLSDFFKAPEPVKYPSEYDNNKDVDKFLAKTDLNEVVEDNTITAPKWDDNSPTFIDKGKAKAIDIPSTQEAVIDETIVQETSQPIIEETTQPRSTLLSLFDQIKSRRNDKDIITTPNKDNLELDTTKLNVENIQPIDSKPSPILENIRRLKSDNSLFGSAQEQLTSGLNQQVIILFFFSNC